MGGESNDMRINFNHNINKIGRICQCMVDCIREENIRGSNYTPFPFAPQLYFPQFNNESEVDESKFQLFRSTAIEFCMTILKKCDEVHVYNPKFLSSGVMDDIEMASELGIPVVFKVKYPWEE